MRPMNGKAKRVEYLVAKFINERRVDRGLNRLDTDRALVAAAREHSRDMARRGFFDHINPDGLSPHNRCRRYDNVGECISGVTGFDRPPGEIAAEVVERLMKSKPHRKSLMKSGNEKMGVGVWKDGQKVLASIELVGATYASYGNHVRQAPRQRDKNHSPQPAGKLEQTLSKWAKKLTP